MTQQSEDRLSSGIVKFETISLIRHDNVAASLNGLAVTFRITAHVSSLFVSLYL